MRSYYLLYRVVSYVDILKIDYATISLKGVTRNRADDETDFTAMERFEYEYRQFHKLRNVSASLTSCYYIQYNKLQILSRT